jgi:hypothetical protein
MEVAGCEPSPDVSTATLTRAAGDRRLLSVRAAKHRRCCTVTSPCGWWRKPVSTGSVIRLRYVLATGIRLRVSLARMTITQPWSAGSYGRYKKASRGGVGARPLVGGPPRLERVIPRRARRGRAGGWRTGRAVVRERSALVCFSAGGWTCKRPRLHYTGGDDHQPRGGRCGGGIAGAAAHGPVGSARLKGSQARRFARHDPKRWRVKKRYRRFAPPDRCTPPAAATARKKDQRDVVYIGTTPRPARRDLTRFRGEKGNAAERRADPMTAGFHAGDTTVLSRPPTRRAATCSG